MLMSMEIWPSSLGLGLIGDLFQPFLMYDNGLSTSPSLTIRIGTSFLMVPGYIWPMILLDLKPEDFFEDLFWAVARVRWVGSEGLKFEPIWTCLLWGPYLLSRDTHLGLWLILFPWSGLTADNFGSLIMTGPLFNFGIAIMTGSTCNSSLAFMVPAIVLHPYSILVLRSRVVSQSLWGSRGYVDPTTFLESQQQNVPATSFMFADDFTGILTFL